MVAHPDLYEQTRLEYDRLAPSYGRGEVDESLVQLFKKYLRPASRILDLGAGPGNYSRRFAALGHSVVALDNSPAMIEEIGRRGDTTRITPLCSDMRDLNFEEGHFDAVFASSSLIHLIEDDLPPVLASLHNCLTRHGCLLANFAISEKGLRFIRTGQHEFISNGRFFQHYPNDQTVLDYATGASFIIAERTRREVRPTLEDGTLGYIEWLNVVARPAK